jgi:hypothetical protein
MARIAARECSQARECVRAAHRLGRRCVLVAGPRFERLCLSCVLDALPQCECAGTREVDAVARPESPQRGCKDDSPIRGPCQNRSNVYNSCRRGGREGTNLAAGHQFGESIEGSRQGAPRCPGFEVA